MPEFLNKVTIVPNNNLDNIFAKNIKSYLNQIWQNQQETLTEIRKTLLPKLISGKIRL